VRRPPCVVDEELQKMFASTFEHKETKDQLATLCDVVEDLSSPFPMNRLLCGDVGFGKTEVALRAIVRASASNKQTLFLCPTTVLSDQHYITAKERLGPLGIRVSLLSRFQTNLSIGLFF
jgi:transcription-repair coupling factor (superfamily II helicase)